MRWFKPQTKSYDENNVLHRLLNGRDTRWYAGDLLKLNLIIVSPSSVKQGQALMISSSSSSRR